MSARSEIPVIFVSALQDVEDRVQGFEVGGVDFVSKPFQESEVLARVRTHLQLRTMQLHLEELVAERTAELKEANQVISESEERFRATFEQAAVGIALVAPDGRFLRLNQKFCDIVGYSLDEMLERTFQDITHSDDLDTDLEYLRQLLAGEIETYSMEKRYFRKGGEIVWVNLTVSLLREATGEPDYFISVIEDITERKKLQEERDRILNTSRDMICIAGMDGYFKYLNPAWGSTLGYTSEELLARPLLDFIHPDDHAGTDIELERLAAGHQTVNFENRYIHKDGSIRYISWMATPILDEKVMYCIGRNVTERKRAEEALVVSEGQFRSLMEQSPYSIQVANLDGSVAKVNQACLNLWGISEEMLPEVLEKYNVLEDAESAQLGVMPLLEKAFRGEVVTLPIVEYDGASALDNAGVAGGTGNKRWIQARFYPVKSSEGELLNVVGMEEDITERMLAVQAVEVHQQKLKALTTELILAEERERRRIAADLHDEVGQSLVSARIQLAVAKQVSPESEVTAMLDDVSDTIRQVIRDTRDLVFDLSSPLLNELGLVAALAKWLEEQVETKVGLQTELIDKGLTVIPDEDIRVIMYRNTRELLTNVVKHAQASKVSIYLEHLDDMVMVTVEDDGIGFDSQAAFDALDHSGGFGLFSIRERMLDLGGRLEVCSEPGQGCTATLTAPLNHGSI